MDITSDEKLYNSFEELTDSLRRSLHSRDDAELLFWLQTYQLIAQSKIEEKGDALRIVMNRICGNDDYCEEVYYLAVNQPETYRQFMQKYQISDVLSELGEHWKRQLCRPSIVHALSLQAGLKGFTEECMPTINDIISEIETEWGGHEWNQLTENDLKWRQQAYKAYRTRLRKLIAKLDVAKELYNIRREDPDFYNNED